jgi:mercuric ion transport protein
MIVRPGVTTVPGEAGSTLQKVAPGRMLLSFGGILAALAAASCCVLPFTLFVLGVSGAWIGSLTALEPYRPIFVALAVGSLAAGYYAVYRKPNHAACTAGSYCASPASDRIAKIGLWTGSALIAVALGFPYVMRYFLA